MKLQIKKTKHRNLEAKELFENTNFRSKAFKSAKQYTRKEKHRERY